MTEVEHVRAGLPEDLREKSVGGPVFCQMLPGEELLDEGEFDDDLLGLFVGEDYAQTGMSDDPTPPRIYLFLMNIWDYSDGDPRVFRREVRKTYLHELGHYLGLDEEDLERRGMG